MLEVRHLECVRGDHRLFAGLDFSLGGGELLRLSGSNGSGKTTLLRTVCGLVEPMQGEVCWQGENIRRQRDEFNGALTYLGHQNGVKAELTAYENLRVLLQLSGNLVSKNNNQDTEDRIYAALGQIGLQGREDLPTQVLSQGQKRRVALARLLLSNTALWVLDEPFTALDVKAVEMLSGIIGDHLQKGGMAIVTTHQEVTIEAGAVHELNLDEVGSI